MTKRPLAGFVLGISISEAEDLHQHGFRTDDVNLVTLELCQRFVALGASVILGHQWRPNGVMEAVTRFARDYVVEDGHQQPIIHNFLAWPDKAALSKGERADLHAKALVKVHDNRTPEERPAALRTMRREMAKRNDARICLGGKFAQPSSAFVSGVLEEAALSCEAGKPVFCSAMMGGVSRLITEACERQHRADDLVSHFSPSNAERTIEYLRRTIDGCVRSPDVGHAENIDTLVDVVSRHLRSQTAH